MTQFRGSGASGIESPASTGWEGHKVRLRTVDAADARVLAALDRYSATTRSTPDVGGHRHWAAHRSTETDSSDTQFAIETLRGGTVIGSIYAYPDPPAGIFSYSVGISPLHRRCGYASDAIRVLLANMFGERGFHTCEVVVHSGNVGSLSLHGVLGFQEVDRIPDTEVARGAIKYMVHMSINAPEFHTHPTNLAPPSRGRHSRPRRGNHRNGPHRPSLFG